MGNENAGLFFEKIQGQIHSIWGSLIIGVPKVLHAERAFCKAGGGLLNPGTSSSNPLDLVFGFYGPHFKGGAGHASDTPIKVFSR